MHTSMMALDLLSKLLTAMWLSTATHASVFTVTVCTFLLFYLHLPVKYIGIYTKIYRYTVPI